MRFTDMANLFDELVNHQLQLNEFEVPHSLSHLSHIHLAVLPQLTNELDQTKNIRKQSDRCRMAKVS